MPFWHLQNCLYIWYIHQIWRGSLWSAEDLWYLQWKQLLVVIFILKWRMRWESRKALIWPRHFCFICSSCSCIFMSTHITVNYEATLESKFSSSNASCWTCCWCLFVLASWFSLFSLKAHYSVSFLIWAMGSKLKTQFQQFRLFHMRDFCLRCFELWSSHWFEVGVGYNWVLTLCKTV